MYQLRTINSKTDEQLFFKLPQQIYCQDPNWVEPINTDLKQIFSPAHNKSLKNSVLKRWIVLKNTQVVGRIAAFYNPRYRNMGDGDLQVGGIGFFECIEEQNVANMLFQEAQKFLTEQGCQAMDGPINLGERDKFWGLLVEGFTRPLYGMNYNPAYYQKLFENYGFRPFYYQLCFGIKQLQTWQQARMQTVYEHICQDKNYTLRTLNQHNLWQFAQDFVHIYNAAWAKHQGNKQLHSKQVYAMLQKMRFVIEPGLSYFAYYKDEPVAMMINLPDLNFYFKDFAGRLGWWEKLQFLWKKRFHKPDKIVGMVYGVHPKVQGKGVDALMIMEFKNFVQRRTKYTQYEMQWIGDFNPKMLSVAEKITPTITRKLATYRYLFNPQTEFHRHPIF